MKIDISKLAKMLQDAVEHDLDEKVAVAFSGGLDSTTIATIAKNKSQVSLITVGVENSEDLIAAKKVAKDLKLNLYEVLVNEEILFEDYKKMWKLMPGTLVDIELMCAIYEVCKKAKEIGCSSVLFGSGAEELFIGYHKYYCALEEKKDLDQILKKEIETLPKRDILRTQNVAKICGVRAIFPLLHKPFVDIIFEIPAKDRIGPIEMKKPLLREIAKKLGVSDIAISRQKKAMQYGSNIHKIFLQMAKEKKIETYAPREPFVYDE